MSTKSKIGLLSPRPGPFLIDPFVAAMRELGWVEGRDFLLEPRYTGGDVRRARALAQDLVGAKVDLVLTISTARGRAATSPDSASMETGRCSQSTFSCSKRRCPR